MVTWFGTPGADTRRGTDAADWLWGRAGNDALSGLGGDDFLYGEAGDDVLRGGAGRDRLYGEIYYPPPGDDLIPPRTPPGRNDSLYGEGGDDFLNGGPGDDLLNGGPGNDKLNGWTGSDRLYGGDGDDELDAGVEGYSYEPLTFRIDKLYGGAGNDTLIGRSGNDILDGGAGDDNLLGGHGADHLIGGEGNDTLDAGTYWYGNFLEGGPGDDLYRIYMFYIEEASSGVKENPGQGIDTVEFRGELFQYDGSELPEVENFIILADGDEFERSFLGNELDNKIFAKAGSYWDIDGLAGNDVIYGFNGGDSLKGGEGNDRLIGGLNSDRLSGGEGWDDFQFNKPSDSSDVDGGRGIDRIEDFMVGLDDLVFSGSFDADTTMAGRQKLSFVGESSDPERGQLAYRHEGGDTLLIANLDNDLYAEFQVRMTGLWAVSNNDVLIY